MRPSRSKSKKRAFVSGCFDILHAGHVAFLESAAKFGELTVAIGSDQTITRLKGTPPIMRETERVLLVQSLRMVAKALISRGDGVLDFARELGELGPDIFVVNDDGHDTCKEALCRELGIEYVVLRRVAPEGLAEQSSSRLRRQIAPPYRVDLAGGWLDQPFVSVAAPGPVIVASVEPGQKFDDRSGMATSTRRTACKLWGSRLPIGDPLETARLLFGAENPPGKEPVAGSQDALGICLPGASRLHYEGGYWPTRVESIVDNALLNWLEALLWLCPLSPRAEDFDVSAGRDITPGNAARLAEAAQRCWDAITSQDATALGGAVWHSFQAQLAMFPAMMTSQVENAIEQVKRTVLGCKLTGAGGGGYLLLVTHEPPRGCLGLHIRRQLF